MSPHKPDKQIKNVFMQGAQSPLVCFVYFHTMGLVDQYNAVAIITISNHLEWLDLLRRLKDRLWLYHMVGFALL